MIDLDDVRRQLDELVTTFHGRTATALQREYIDAAETLAGSVYRLANAIDAQLTAEAEAEATYWTEYELRRAMADPILALGGSALVRRVIEAPNTARVIAAFTEQLTQTNRTVDL